MTRSRLRIVLAALLATVGSVPACRSSDARPLERAARAVVITHVTVVDPGADSSLRDMTVVVTGTRITHVGPSASTVAPRDADVVHGTGKYLIPGLWDMHVHALDANFDSSHAPLFLAHGVTGVRDMGDDVPRQLDLQRRVAAGTLLAPRIVTSARVDGDVPRHASYSAILRSAAQAPALADSLRTLGVNLLKVYGNLPRDAYFELARHARGRGIPFAGHVPRGVTLVEAARAGQRSIEHTDDLEFACGTRELSRKAELAAASDRAGALRDAAAVNDSMLAIMRRTARAMRDAADASVCSATLRTMVAHGTWLVPTLVVYQPYARAFGPGVVNDSALRWVPRRQRARWAARARGFTAAETAVVAAFFDFAHVARAGALGVPLMTGTDTPLPYVIPGTSVHEELALLVRAGLTPRAALAAATREPARYLGADTLGAIRVGAVADLVLLGADPLSAIANSRRIEAVVANGRLLRRSALDGMLAAAARVAPRR